MGKIPVMLGGEHTVTYAALKALKDAGEEFGVIQFDAHADLRDTYEGDKFSHACVMRRAIEMELPLFQIGVRSLSLSEVELRKKRIFRISTAMKSGATEFLKNCCRTASRKRSM